jgi:hypothetical protein
VQVDLRPQQVGVLREAAGVLVGVRPLAPRVAQQELVVDQVHGAVGVGGDGRVTFQVRLGRHGVAGLPAAALVGAQDGSHLGG